MGARNIIYWERVRGPRVISALTVATAAGAGLFPIAPGTMGTAFAMPLAYFTLSWDWPARLALIIALTIAGTWAAKIFDETMQTGDNQCIVMDEVIGFLITGFFLPSVAHSWLAWVAAFVLFRLFDIVKLPPVRQLDRWSKNKSGYWGGFGVMADDILAGLQGLAVMLILQWLGVFSHT